MVTSLADHRGADIDRWVDAYSGGDPVDKATIFSGVSNALAPVLPGYRYLKSKGTFLLSDETADHYITLERGKGIVSLRFGVTQHAVERTREALFGPRTVYLRHVPLTVSMYTANMGPHSRGWYLPYRVQWPVLGSEGLLLAVPEITAFVQDTVLPYLQQHRSPEAIRDTYLRKPRHADVFLLSEQIVFAVDYFLGRSRRELEDDRDTLLSLRGAPDDQRRVQEGFLTVLGAMHAV